ncbi:7-cyano-7-deazaguanine synthase [Streptomyces varsoviensis]|uniref:7-cyano-7-deazaguanine synthase n=1 Tax=Streptomyces varsoviensis TaxID=67373 RepID=A0ABR5J455_9ACTN|nr:7-cyano-7-deazaguanine synthase [Streptomyces varsoviensis]KOG88175.1 hypothetical protein ADK38_21265 [Streptomyces varsoviensis]
MSQRRAVCLLSGGPDSVVAAAIARDAGYLVSGLYVDYGQRTASREAEFAARNAAWLGVESLRTAAVPFLGEIKGSALTDTDSRVTDETRHLEYVPFRNTVLNSLAIAWAETLGAERVVTGSIGGPWITPDNSPDYFRALNDLIAVGTRSDITAWAPLGECSKAESLRRGIDLGVPLGETWSCQNDSDVPCGECNNCLDRSRAFKELGVQDPLG